MDRSRLITVLVFLLAGALFIWWWQSDKFNWNTSYSAIGNQPYDLSSFREILVNSTTENNWIYWEIPLTALNDSVEFSTYFFAGSYYFTDSLQLQQLFNRLNDGASAFFLIPDASDELNEFLPNNGFYLRSMGADSLLFHYHFGQQQPLLFFRNGRYVTQNVIRGIDNRSPKLNENIISLGEVKVNATKSYVDTLVHFFKIPVGEKGGACYFYTVPLPFTNYELSKEAGYAHIAEILSQLPDGPILWDRHSAMYALSSRAPEEDRTLQYLIQKRGYRLAWISLLAGGFLLLLFGGRRKSRAIPLMTPPLNRSVGFARSLGALYLRSGNPRFLAEEMMRLFDNYNRRKYSFQRDIKERDKAVKKLHQLTGVSEKQLHTMFQQEWELRYTPGIDAKHLLPFYRNLQRYYQQTQSK